jgi:uncharacterized membrane protein YccC
MSQTVTVSDDLFHRLEQTVAQRGLGDVEQLLEAWQRDEEERELRRQAVQRIDRLREKLLAAHGEQPDSVPLIREDRERGPIFLSQV